MSLSRAREKLVGRLRSRRLREREGLVLVEGPHAIGVALEAGARFRFALVSETLLPGGRHPAVSDPPVSDLLFSDPTVSDLPVSDSPARLLAALEAAGVDVVPVPSVTLAELADTEHPQGLLAVVEEPTATLEGWRDAVPTGAGPGPSPLLVLDRIQDPGNAGTLIRSAAAFGSPGVVALDGTVDPWNPKVVRASAGEAFRIPVVRSTWEAFDVWRRSLHLPLLVADAGGEDVRRFQVQPPQILLVGNEGSGPRPEALAASGTILALPLAPGVESLNAAMAGSILLWALGPGAACVP
jgi:TrmH family RNA methyltransferase